MRESVARIVALQGVGLELAGVPEETRAVRSTAMVEDKSPLDTVHIHGPDSERFVNRLIPRDASRISVDHAYYTPW